MDKEYIKREIDKCKIKERSGMNWDNNLHNILQEIASDLTSEEQAKRTHEKELAHAFGWIPVKDADIRKKRVTESLQEFVLSRSPLDKELSFKLHVLFDEVDDILFSDLPSCDQPGVFLDLEDWVYEYLKYYTTDPEAFNNTEISKLIYQLLDLLNTHIRHSLDTNDICEKHAVADKLEIISFHLLQFSEYVFN